MIDIETLAIMVEKTREAQNHYFEVKRTDKGNWAHINSCLKISKEWEKELDAAVKDILHKSPQSELF